MKTVVLELAFSFCFDDASPSKNSEVLTRNGLFHAHFNKDFCNSYLAFSINELNNFLPEFMIDGSKN